MGRAATNDQMKPSDPMIRPSLDEELGLILQAIAQEKVPDRLLILAADLQELLEPRMRRHKLN